MTEQDWKNILALIQKAPITGADAILVTSLITKIVGEINSFHTPVETATPGTEAV